MSAQRRKAPTPEALVLKADLQDAPLVAALTAGDVSLAVRFGRDSLWVVASRRGAGLALRTAWSPGGGLCEPTVERRDNGLRLTSRSPMGFFEVEITVPDLGEALFRASTRLTPEGDLAIPYWPRDLYPVDEGGDPTATETEVLAAQRGLNGGVCFFPLPGGSARQKDGAVLYFQNFTALNDYFRATETAPDSVVGGEPPELGYQPPGGPRARLPGGARYTMGDAIIAMSDRSPRQERDAAYVFLSLLAAIYRQLELPPTCFNDWPARAEKTLHDLEVSDKVKQTHFGDCYVRPYVDAEYPDSMAQLAVALPIRHYGAWKGGGDIPLERALRKGAERFYDPDLKTVRRYLPDVGEDKDADEVDSWYLYHPLANLGRYALDGDEGARAIFFRSIDFAIKAAQHFDYRWPILFNVETFDVIQKDRGPGMPGQSDVGGLYAYVMLQAYELSGGELRYFEEARRGVEAMKGLKFDLVYQTNLTAWGTQACLKLFRMTGERFFLEQSYVLLAGFFHNTVFWESRIGCAEHYQVFLGATCLHDGPYMAIYECFESFAAFRDYLDLGGEDIDPAVRLLLTEYGRYVLSRAIAYYPDAIPKDLPASDNRNGHIDRGLSIPMEDLYADGQQPGQVGQEVYGCGAAFTFAMRAFHRIKGAPFLLFCDYPVRDLKADGGALSLRIDGDPDFRCRLRLIPQGSPLPQLTLTVSGKPVAMTRLDDGAMEAALPGGAQVEARWKALVEA